MATGWDSPGARLRGLWGRLAPLPGGKRLFSFILGWINPYSGSIHPRIVALEPGYARIELRDRRRVRNHLNSIHAVALLNLGEMATGFAMLTGLSATTRGIVTALSITYHKKARGLLTAECRCDVPEVTTDRDYEAVAAITDTAGDVVARVTARWRLGPNPKAAR